jgi:lysophospholipase L1-like esterase
VDAQTPGWDSTFRPNNWALKVDQFRSYPDSREDIIFLGNSITAGIEWRELLGNDKVRNRGISGDITYGVIERLSEVTDGKPSKVFVLIGINDISRNIPDSLVIDNYRRIIRFIKERSPQTRIFFHTLLPVNNEFTQFKNHYNKDEHILFVNRELKKIAATENITLIDLYPAFTDATQKLAKKYTIDGLHINAEGYKVWADILHKGRYL